MTDFEHRLQRLIEEPENVRGFWLGAARPYVRLFNVQPQIRVAQLRAYVDAVKAGKQDNATLKARAHAEFESTLRSLERTQVAYHKVEPRLLNWAHRILSVLVYADRVSDHLASDQRRRAYDASKALTSLAPSAFSLLEARKPRGAENARLDCVEAVLQAAHAERDFLGRRRNLLQAARELLIDAAAQVVNEGDVRERLESVAQEMGELDRLQAMGILSDVALPHQLQSALAQRATQRVNAILSVMEHQAAVAGDEKVRALSSAALEQLWQGQNRFDAEYRAHSLRQSAQDAYSDQVLAAAQRCLAAAKEQFEREKPEQYGPLFVLNAAQYFSDDGFNELIQAALYVDACVDVGGVLSPQRVLEQVTTTHEVRHPTQHLKLVHAQGLDDLPTALINDPRTLLADMATGRLLTRRYVGQQTRHIERRAMASEVRIFLLDGSGSMLGPRARMRDAILVAELSTMIARLNDANRWLTPTLYYRYFTRRLGEVVRVSTAAEALDAIECVLSEVRHGGTDIEGALLGSFETIKQEQQVSGSDLRRAQVVLVTDGEAPVDEMAILEARDRISGVPIGVSIIALGEENPALRAFAAGQRAAGQRIFYQHLDDGLLTRLTQGQLQGLTLHLPSALEPSALCDTLTSLIDEIHSTHRTRDAEALLRARDEQAALGELGVAPPALSEAERARLLLLTRDFDALQDRFCRWFPLNNSGKTQASARALQLELSADDSQLAETIKPLMLAVAEVTELVGSNPNQRQLDAIEMFERLLLERHLTFLHYQTLINRYPAHFEAELARVWAATTLTPRPPTRAVTHSLPAR